MGAWNIERIDTAHRAEKVLRHPRIERIRRKTFFALEQAKLRFRHDKMQISRLGAHRAIAIQNVDARWGGHLESDLSAVTASAMTHDGSFDFRSCRAVRSRLVLCNQRVVLDSRKRVIEMMKQTLPLLIFRRAAKADGVRFERCPVDQQRVLIRRFQTTLQLM